MVGLDLQGKKEVVYEFIESLPVVLIRREFFILCSSSVTDGYYVAYKPITLPYILFVFIEMKFIHCYSCVMFAMKSMSMCND